MPNNENKNIRPLDNQLTDWGNTRALAGVGERVLQSLSAAGEWQDIAADTRLISEGDVTSSLQIICSGRAQVFKASSDGVEHQINEVGAGDILGEPALLAGTQLATSRTKAMASVTSAEPMRVFKISLERLSNDPRLAQAHDALIRNSARFAISRLDDANETSAAALRDVLNRQRTFAAYLVNLILVFSLFALSLYALDDMLQWFGQFGWTLDSVRWVHSILFSLLLFVGFWVCLRRTNVSLSDLGALPPRWRSDLAMAALWAVPMLVVMALLRVRFYPGENVFYPYLLIRGPFGSWWQEISVAVFYFGFMCPMQEFVTRIGLQAMLLQNLLNANRTESIQAIVISAVGFGAFHAVFGLQAVVITFALGVYLGLMFHFYRSLAAVALCHIIAGAAGFYWFGLIR